MPAKAKLTTRERTTSNVSSDNLNKGSELSFAEADSNFFNLRDQTFAISDGSTSTDIEAGETITFSGATVSGNTVTITGGDSLGDLTAVGSTLSAPSNADLTLQPGGTGNVVIDGLTYPGTDGTNGQMIITDGSGNLSFSSNPLTSFGDLTAIGSTIASPSNANLTLDPSGTGNVVINGVSELNGATTISGNATVTGDVKTHTIRPRSANNNITIEGNGTTSNINIISGTSSAVSLKGKNEITFDVGDAVGTGGVLSMGSTYTRFNRGGNDIQNLLVHNNSNTGVTDGLLHIETYRDVVTINDSGIAYNGSSLKFEGQGTETFNVFGTARLDNIFFQDNKIYTNQSNEDLELECSGTGTLNLKLPTSSTIGSNGGASALTANPVGYVKIKINGTAYQIPYYNV